MRASKLIREKINDVEKEIYVKIMDALQKSNEEINFLQEKTDKNYIFKQIIETVDNGLIKDLPVVRYYNEISNALTEIIVIKIDIEGIHYVKVSDNFSMGMCDINNIIIEDRINMLNIIERYML